VTIERWDGEVRAVRLGLRSPGNRRGRPDRQSVQIVAFSAVVLVRALRYVLCSWTGVGKGECELEGREGRGEREGYDVVGRTCDERALVVERALEEGWRGYDASRSRGGAKLNRRAQFRRCSPTPRRPLLQSLYTRRPGCLTIPGRPKSLPRQ
jgi:hypothetical protein